MSALKVLVVDDESQIRFALRRFLELKGYEVQEAESCKAAVESCNILRPDAVLLDYMLPDGNALDLLASLREIQLQIPIIVLTGHGTTDLAESALKEGAEYFLTKPVALTTLHVILQQALETSAAKALSPNDASSCLQLRK